MRQTLDICSSLFSLALINTMTRSNLEKKKFISAERLQSVIEGNWDRDPHRTEAEAVEGCCLLACSLTHA